MSASFRMTGGKALEAALTEMKRSTAKAVVRRALNKAAEPILAKYQAGTDVVTGTLQRSEVIGTKLNKRQSKMNRKLASRSAVEVHVGTADPAGIQEEFGNRHQAGNAALARAWASEGEQAAVDRIGEELAREIDKTAKRAAKRGG